MSLSPASLIVLTRAAERPDHRLQFHRKLPTGGRHKMIDALLRDGLITETLGDYRLGDASTLIEDATTGLMLTTLALTDAGFHAIDLDPPGATTDANTAPPAASDDAVAQEAAAIADALDAANVAPTPRANLRASGTPRKPREGTKQEAVLTLLRRTEGATIAQIMETTSWANHTCRGFLAGLKKKGIKVETLEKVRMVGPNKEGAKGSYSVYAITE